MKNFTDRLHHQVNQRGFSLMEVLIGIGIFAIGMLALASLQGALTRSTAEAKIRTAAVNIAERVLEEQQGFAQVTGGAFSFMGITDVTTPIIYDSTMTRNPATPEGVSYYVTQDVTNYYYDLASDSFTTTDPTGTGTAIPDYKTVVVNVAWTDDLRNYVIDEGTETTGNLGGGSVDVSTTISAMSTVNAVRVAEQEDRDIIAPDIVYTPGENPDIVSLGLGDNKFKESLTPEPKVYRSNSETRFDVVTYSQSVAGAFFLRREEFVAVSCDCTLNAASADNQGYTPVVWAGDEYTDPVPMTKPYGTPAANVSQSPLCTACCRDHHDASGSPLYDPARPTDKYSGGDHNHYYKQGGTWHVAGVGDNYLEACRLVRKDGFFRLTQDFHLEGLNTFAEDYLITDTQVEDYSEYVIGEVYGTPVFVDGKLSSYTPVSSSYVPKAITEGATSDDLNYHLADDPPTVATAPRTASGSLVEGDLTLGYTYLPTSTNTSFQQLRGRSIYIDYLSNDLRDTITCIQGKSADELTADPSVCDRGDVVLDKTGSFNILELIPFFEIQTTYLNDWQKHDPAQEYFSLTNQIVTTSDVNGPTHSRGEVTNLPKAGADMVHTLAYRGVTGLTSTDPINDYDTFLPYPGTGWEPGHIKVITGVTPPAPAGKVITITLRSEVSGLKAANVGFSTSNAKCSYVTTGGIFTCFIPDGTSSPSLTVTNFDKPPKEIRLCSSHQFGLPAELPVTSYNGVGAPKTVNLTNALAVPVSPAEPYRLWLTEASCPADPGGGWGG